MIRHILISAFLVIVAAVPALSQNVAVKTNALYWATTTPNIGVEASMCKKHSVQLINSKNQRKEKDGDKTSFRNWVLNPEYRYWFCEAFNGWFVGAHLNGGQFNVASIDMPFGLFDELKDHRYEGWFAGGGISAGYQWVMSKHWNLEASLGIGYDYIKYDKFKCGECGEKLFSGHKNYFGPTKLALSVLYIF